MPLEITIQGSGCLGPPTSDDTLPVVSRPGPSVVCECGAFFKLMGLALSPPVFPIDAVDRVSFLDGHFALFMVSSMGG